jgi:hypothetical protein
MADETPNNRVLYKHTSATSYLFSAASRYWLIGDNYNAKSGKAYGTGRAACPTESTGWHVFKQKSWMKSPDIEIKCGTEWSIWSRCDKSCGGGIAIRDRFDEANMQVRETKDCNSHACPLDCAEDNKNSHCRSWAQKGYCTVKFARFMQKNCSQSCCLNGQLIEFDERNNGAKTGVLCDFMNIFNDDSTEPPSGYFQELVIDEVNCDNWADIKEIWNSNRPVARSELIEDEEQTPKSVLPFWRIQTDPNDSIEGNIIGSS